MFLWGLLFFCLDFESGLSMKKVEKNGRQPLQRAVFHCNFALTIYSPLLTRYSYEQHQQMAHRGQRRTLQHSWLGPQVLLNQ